jgi:hypothetical protein
MDIRDLVDAKEVRLPWGRVTVDKALNLPEVGQCPTRYSAGTMVLVANPTGAPSVAIVVFDYGPPDSVLVARFNVYREKWNQREQADRKSIIGPILETA